MHLSKATLLTFLWEENCGGGRESPGQHFTWLLHGWLIITYKYGCDKAYKRHSKVHIWVIWCSSRNEQWIPEDWTTHGTIIRKKKMMEKKGLKGWQWFFIFFWSQFIFLWAKRTVPPGWSTAAFPGSHIYHTKGKHHKGDSMINTWFRDPRIECPEMRIRIYLSPWNLGSRSSNILSKVCFKTPNLFIGLRH